MKVLTDYEVHEDWQIREFFLYIENGIINDIFLD